ncbi:hypothetical protein, partial [uncultured Parasphingorhabdus sp.]|uniref:hypothetical protein n=1 Tax=uncultured Parasphingorhabdus sp. TaxID=2709694 RepID=UPI0030D6E9CC
QKPSKLTTRVRFPSPAPAIYIAKYPSPHLDPVLCAQNNIGMASAADNNDIVHGKSLFRK